MSGLPRAALSFYSNLEGSFHPFTRHGGGCFGYCRAGCVPRFLEQILLIITELDPLKVFSLLDSSPNMFKRGGGRGSEGGGVWDQEGEGGSYGGKRCEREKGRRGRRG